MSRSQLLTALLALLYAASAQAQAWTQSPGHTYVKLSYGAATAGEQYTFDGRRKPFADNVETAAFFDRSAYLYTELGLLPQLTVVGALSYRRIFARDEAWSYASGSIGDLELGLRYTPDFVRDFMPSGGAMAVNLQGKLPTFYVRNQLPAAGTGQVDLTLTLDYGQSLFGGIAYAQVGAGVKVKTPWYGLSRAVPCAPGDTGCNADERPDLADAWVGKAELGVRPWQPILLQLLGQATVSIEPPDVGFAVGQTVPTHERVVKTGVGLQIEPIKHLALSGQAYVTPWGRSTSRSVDIFFGISSEFDLWR